VQIDVENAERYGIEYMTEDGKKRYPIVLHCSPSGAVERNIYAMLEKEWMRSEKRGLLPLWLCPTQVRVIPVSDKFLPDAEELCKTLNEKNIRSDIDDRNESVEKKVRYAEMEWVPYSIVIGEKELKSGNMAVRTRKDGLVRNIPLEEAIHEVKKQTEGKPFRTLTLSRLLSMRPKFN
jgi:threonyl-tRNA synthetase